MSITKSALKATYGGKTDNVDYFSAALWDNVLGATDASINAIIAAIEGGDTGDGKFYVNGEETTATDGVVTLAVGGTYILQGTLEGKVVIGASTDEPTDDTHVVLAGVNIKYTGTDNKAISYEAGTQSMQVTLAKNTTNLLQCSNVAEMAEQQGACLYSEKNMILQGNGYLLCQNKGGHGVKASELRITGNPHIYVDSIHDGIHGNSALNVDGGVFYITNANDAFGTGDTGSVKMFGGEIYAYGIQQNVIDSKVAGYLFDNIAISTDTAAADVLSGVTKVDPKVYFGGAVQDTENGGYTTEASGTVKCYSDEAMTADEAVITAVDGVYTLTTAYAKVEGYVEGKIVAPTKSTNIELANAYVAGSIEYTADKKKLQINVEKENLGIVTGDITSGSNLTIEVKGGAYLIAKGNVSGDEMTFNDSKGVLIVEGDVTGKDIYIGTQASADASKFLQGGLIVRGTVKAILNSKFNKGWIHVLASNLTGVFSADTINAAGYADLGASTHVFYHKAVGTVIGSKTIEADDYKTI